MNDKTHYDNLEVSRLASQKVIRSAYKTLAQTWHPDKRNGDPKESERKMISINASYSILSNPHLRKVYDETLDKESTHKEKAYDDDFSENNDVKSYSEQPFQRAYSKEYEKKESNHSKKTKNRTDKRLFLVLFIMVSMLIYLNSSSSDIDFLVFTIVFFVLCPGFAFYIILSKIFSENKQIRYLKDMITLFKIKYLYWFR